MERCGDTLNTPTWKAKFVKTYSWLKEELTSTGTKAVADHLYQSGELDEATLETICEFSSRRQTVEKLLKRVLLGNEQIYQEFIKALKETDGHIVAKLEETIVSSSEQETFKALERFALGRCNRRGVFENRFRLTDSDKDVLIYFLNKEIFIDCTNDHFLSQFYFSIREHTNICQCELHSEIRIRKLLDTMNLCSDKIYDALCDVLSVTKMAHVIDLLEYPQQVASVQDFTRRSARKRRYDGSFIEHRLVNNMRRSSETLNRHTTEYLDFSVQQIDEGSILIQLFPNSKKSWKKFKDSCATGRIGDLVKVVYGDGSIQHLLGNEEHQVQLTVYICSSKSLQHGHPEKWVVLQLERNETRNNDKTVSIEDHMEYLTEELDVTKPLLEELKKHRVVGKNIEEELEHHRSRAMKVKTILDEVKSHGDSGYEALLTCLGNENNALSKELKRRDDAKILDGKTDEAEKIAQKLSLTNTTMKKYHSCTVIVTGQEKVGKMARDKPAMDVTIPTTTKRKRMSEGVKRSDSHILSSY